MKAKTLAIAGSIGVLSFAALPVAQAAAAAPQHRAPAETRVDRSRDVAVKKHLEKSQLRTPDRSRDIRDR